MIKIEVVSTLGRLTENSLSAEFSSEGGSIGRALSNLLVLDDAERTVSRIHAKIILRNGTFFIIDKGSNPLSCNGVVVGSDNEAPIKNGDTLQIGSFQLLVSTSSSRSLGTSPSDELPQASNSAEKSSFSGSDDPFADLLAGLTPAAAPPQPVAKSAGSPNASNAPAMFSDPMGLDKPNAKADKVDPFDDLMNFGSASPAAAQSHVGNDLGGFVGLPDLGSSSLDDLFGLGPSKSGADPFAQSPLASPLFQPNTASSDDPMSALLGDVMKPTAASRSDNVPALQQAYKLPEPVDARPKLPPVQSAPPPAQAAQSVTAAVFTEPVPPAKAPVARASTTARAPNAGTADELLAAFLRGIKSTHQMPTELTPELMERIGAMLHTAAHGTLQLLISRQEFKRGVRSDVTMISIEANNPLKFSPTAEVALAHMLGPKVKGFMQAEEAMHNAYADLRAHQLATMVGMRAALAHVLARFTPDKLESRLTEKSALDALFSANRKAKLWDQFNQLYTSIAAEAEDDFHTLFGEAFSKAYDEQMQRFKSDH